MSREDNEVDFVLGIHDELVGSLEEMVRIWKMYLLADDAKAVLDKAESVLAKVKP